MNDKSILLIARCVFILSTIINGDEKGDYQITNCELINKYKSDECFNGIVDAVYNLVNDIFGKTSNEKTS